MEETLRVATAMWLSSVALIHYTVVWSTPCLTRVSDMEAQEMLLNAHSISKKTPGAVTCWSSTFSFKTMIWWRAVSTDIPAW
jgi:hypothetical protein